MSEADTGTEASLLSEDPSISAGHPPPVSPYAALMQAVKAAAPAAPPAAKPAMPRMFSKTSVGSLSLDDLALTPRDKEKSPTPATAATPTTLPNPVPSPAAPTPSLATRTPLVAPPRGPVKDVLDLSLTLDSSLATSDLEPSPRKPPGASPLQAPPVTAKPTPTPAAVAAPPPKRDPVDLSMTLGDSSTDLLDEPTTPPMRSARPSTLPVIAEPTPSTPVPPRAAPPAASSAKPAAVLRPDPEDVSLSLLDDDEPPAAPARQ
ncbi:hypothetical protein PAPYR_2764 [Paratrimastix pyriformis]|uniref:Uncharacterized protein n=1 Tax=Paratrimastix pyriformis TaxID=342808 RepID=A0ABQ8UP06_9EUKA|nr:hypothetical protein PAPYR_2764 [Paratrimastix pyriformis]